MPLSKDDPRPLQPSVRPLREAERRILKWGIIRQRRRLRRWVPVITLVVSLVLFGGLWGLTVFATKADKTGPSWQVSGLIWLAIAIVISAWSHLDLRRHVANYEGNYASALRQDSAVEIQIQSDAVVLFEAADGHGPAYAFQLGDQEIVFFVWPPNVRRSARFPNSDFSMIDLFTERGKRAVGLLEKRGRKMEPVRRISREARRHLNIPEHLSVIPGRLTEIEPLLSSHSG